MDALLPNTLPIIRSTNPKTIASVPHSRQDAEPQVQLLYCPEQGGWHTGVFWEGAWRLHYYLKTVLRPTHWLPAPAELSAQTNSVIQLAWRLQEQRKDSDQPGTGMSLR